MPIILNDYEQLDELGRGGFATVYKVRHRKLGYIRAVRVLNAMITSEGDKNYQKFLEECQLLLRLGNGCHPNIVHINQPLLKDNKAVVEMDYVDGKDLYHYLKEKNNFIEIDDVLRLVENIGSALAYCHEDIYKFCMDRELDNLPDDPDDGSKVLIDEDTRQRLINRYRVIHNDIHSRNIIRRENGSYVLLDFGLAINGDNVARSSQHQNGAPEFKSPEKWEDDAILSTQSDIYSFGILLYEFLTGRVPFVLKNPSSMTALWELGNAHKHQQPDSIFGLRAEAFNRVHPGKVYEKDYPDWLEELILKCLAKAPQDRFANGRELYDFVQENRGDNQSNPIPSSQEEVLKKELDAAQAEKSVLNQEVEQLKKTVEELTARLNLDKSEELQKALDAAQALIRGLEDQLLVARNENKALEQKIAQQPKGATGLGSNSSEVKKLEGQLLAARNENHSLKREVIKLRGDVERLSEAVRGASNNEIPDNNGGRGGKGWKFFTFTLLFALSNFMSSLGLAL